MTDWDTDITPLVGEELLVEVLDDIPLTMHNFVSTVAPLVRVSLLILRLKVFLLFPLPLCRYGKHSSNWLTVISATSFSLTASGVKRVATNFTSTAAARFPRCVWTWIQSANGELAKRCELFPFLIFLIASM